MQVREAGLDDRRKWDDFILASAQSSFLQTWEWGEAQRESGQTIWRFVVEEQSEWRAAILLVRRELPFGWCWLYGPGGPTFASSMEGSLLVKAEVLAALQEKIYALADEERAVWVRLDAPLVKQSAKGMEWSKLLLAQGWEKSEREVQPRETLVLDLTKSEEVLFSEMKSKTRYNVRLAIRKGVTVRWSHDIGDIELFWQLTEEVSGRGGFRYHPREYYEVIMREMNGDETAVGAELAIASFEGEALAVHLMIYAGQRAIYLHGASTTKRREVMAPTLLYWETIKRAKEKGLLLYDFWGVSPEGAEPDHPWAGVTRIKEGFGGSREAYVGAYDRVLQPWMYQAIEVARRAKRMLT